MRALRRKLARLLATWAYRVSPEPSLSFTATTIARREVCRALGDMLAGEVSPVRGRTIEEFRRGKPAHVRARSAESYLEHKGYLERKRRMGAADASASQ